MYRFFDTMRCPNTQAYGRLFVKIKNGMKAGIGLMILALTNPNEEMLRNKVYKKVISDDGHLSTIDVARLNRINFLAFSIAGVWRSYKGEDCQGKVTISGYESPAVWRQSVYDEETRYIGIVGNWFRLPDLFQSY